MKTVNTKKELCELINLVLKADSELTKEILVKGNSINEVYNNIMGNIIFKTHLVNELNDIYETYKSQFEKSNYEKLMTWALNNLSDMIRSDKRKYRLDNLIMDVSSLDIYSVIKGNDDWINFKNDLQGRIGYKF